MGRAERPWMRVSHLVRLLSSGTDGKRRHCSRAALKLESATSESVP
jgi:hypothetical protein